MMTQAGRFPCFEKDGLKAVSLPYGKRRFAMHVFLPPRGSSPAALLQSITPEGWEAWMGSFRPRQGSVSLPRFKVEYAAELNEPLAALGMDAALDPARADFRGILDEGAHITQVRHRTFIEVNEEGTEAAGATSVGVGVTSLEAEPFLMVVDRPFLLAVRDGETGTLLFLGSIADPR
jgi:serpin B